MENPLRPTTTNIPQSNIPFTVCCVVDDVADAHEYEEVTVVRKFCQSHGVRCEVRVYNTARYEEDTLNIRRLPAFHVYDRKKTCQSTFYAEDDPLHRIKTELVRAREEEEAAARGREEWSRRWRSLTGFFQGPRKIATNR
jgi:hypothetical protein